MFKKRLGFIYKRPIALSTQADEEAKRIFNDWYEALRRPLDDDEKIRFLDAVHPEYKNRPAHG